MKIKSLLIAVPVLCVSLLVLDSSSSVYAVSTMEQPADSTTRSALAWDVQTSQQLFTVEMTPVKKLRKKTIINIKAELRDAFRIINCGTDSSYTEIDWTMATEKISPKFGTYMAGTPEYNQVDSIVRELKLKAAKEKASK
ncbi:hypothetical protein [Pedobacter metabolipauper]|uniref:GLPGLI family protein n=1 Tax=Pedobacter metabolipauper TaxID=425513 RepID=A0A4R6SQD6_9SPHI|nr:hypothetical protein [Pedobacter metabolipauper]TDQ06191.1 hypothetical protein ATK78_4572 [Pedobacter metabolipauper]